VRDATGDQVQTWATRVLTASTLDEVFDDAQ
jgi:hypothetical protein